MILEIPKINSSELNDNLDKVRSILSDVKAILIDHNGVSDMVLVDLGLVTDVIDLLGLDNLELPNNKNEQDEKITIKSRVDNVIPFRRRF